jgi:hypothetical protein
MAKKAKAKKAPARPKRQREDSLLVHARAISELAAAIREHAEAIASTKPGRATVLADDAAPAADVALPPLSAGQIRGGIEAVFQINRDLSDDDEINAILEGGPARLVSMWEDFDNYPAFRQRGLAIGPNDLRFVKTVKELVGVIAWGLKNALKR